MSKADDEHCELRSRELAMMSPREMKRGCWDVRRGSLFQTLGSCPSDETALVAGRFVEQPGQCETEGVRAFRWGKATETYGRMC